MAGGLVGLLVGDALGVPYEFHPAHAIPSLDAIEFEPPHDFRRSHGATPPGTWSDDGAQALCLLATLLHRDGFDAGNFANRLTNWLDHGYLAVDGRVFDVGNQTAEAIGRLRRGVEPLKAGGEAEFSQGNGSLMRVLPLALWHRGPDEALVRNAHDQSRVTHGHPVVLACCALYCLWARRLLEVHPQPWEDALSALRAIYADQPRLLEALEDGVRPDAAHTPGGSGFVVDSLFSAREALRAGSYEVVVKTAVSYGEDTDTTACIAGGLAGIRDGVEAIPLRWRDGLRGQDDLAPLLEGLLAAVAAEEIG
ncbi:ADP-ribosylglycohydrolase family protein [Caulobacter mirabilis]|nr:ADP-ribosylglycohydrolase family protein [Caulobacter mirabilis]